MLVARADRKRSALARRERLDQDMNPTLGAGAAGAVADDPAHGVAGGDRDQGLAGLQGNVADRAMTDFG
jgi:hypothetical protein